MSEKILVSDKISEDGIAVLKKAGMEVVYEPEITQERIKEIIGDITGWVVRSRSRATGDIIQKASKLRVIGRAGVGVDNVDVDTATRRGVIVMNTPGGNTTSTAEHSIAMMLSLARKIPQAAASMKAGQWDKKSFMGVEFYGKTLGVLGLGRIGQEVVRRMKAFGMNVVGYDPFVSTERMQQLGVEPLNVDDICRRADMITIHTPLSPETKNLINADRLSLMKKTVLLVNCARGGIVDEPALADALKAKKIAGAALDVFDSEPIPGDHPLRGLDNAILTPHIAASTVEAQENVALQVAEQVIDLLRNGNIRNAVNAPSIDAEILGVLRPYLDLAERLGSFISQFVNESSEGKVIRIEASFSGSLTQYPLAPLTTAAAKGFLQQTTDEAVNYVNALGIMRDRGIEVHETRRSETYQYSNLMTVEVVLETGTAHSVSGTVFSPGRTRIVVVNDKHFDAVPAGHLVVIENLDVPGIIGRVGTLFGAHNINIGQMTWGRTTSDNVAMTVINVDHQVTKEILDELRQTPNIKSARLINL